MDVNNDEKILIKIENGDKLCLKGDLSYIDSLEETTRII